MSSNKRELLLEVRNYGRIIFVGKELFKINCFNGIENLNLRNILIPKVERYITLIDCQVNCREFLRKYPLKRNQNIYISKYNDFKYNVYSF